MTLDNAMITALEDEARWAIQNRLVDARTIPNYLDFYYLDAMKSVKPGAISIVK
jgi:NitT/TauT family transport system substrate-binding protein